jgi:hypothetical protein
VVIRDRSTEVRAEVARRAYAARRLLADALTAQTIDGWAAVLGAYQHLLVIEDLLEVLSPRKNVPPEGPR